jgi:hypothetical protein
MGFLVDSGMPRQVRLSLRTQDQQRPGNQGRTAMPTAAVVLALLPHVALGQCWVEGQAVAPLSGLHPAHLLVCDALGLDSSWDATPSVPKSDRYSQAP